MEKFRVSVKTKTIEDELTYDGNVLITYKIEYPEFSGKIYLLTLKKINKYYLEKALEYKKHIEEELLPIAIEQYKDSIENNFPFRVFEALQVFSVTFNKSCVLSLYTDRYEYTGGAHGSTVRNSETWNLQRAGRVSLSELYVCGGDFEEYLIDKIIRQIEKDPSIYFEDYNKLVRETFNKDSYYCTNDGVVVYFQQYDIAPYASGIREFLIGYSKCVMDPAKKCFVVIK